MTKNETDSLQLVQAYRKLVLQYEALDQQIDTLIMKNDGATENMSPEDFSSYRALARQRDEILNEMRVLEHQLQLDDNAES